MSRSGLSRGGSAAGENKHLRETIVKLQQDLLYSEAQKQKVADQLDCLILLVKRAWTGDKSAARHVANIVGVAPPDLTEEITNGLKVTLTAKPKSRALNNWALLTIGLLNQMYRHMEKDLEHKQRHYLQQRVDFLEDQTVLHRDIQLRLAHKQGGRPQSGQLGDKARPISGSQSSHSIGINMLGGQDIGIPNGHMSGTRVRQQSWADDSTKPFLVQSVHQHPENGNQKISGDRPPPGGGTASQRRPSAKHLYRQPSKDTAEDRMSLSDLFVEPAAHSSSCNTNKVMSGLYQLGPLPRSRSEEEENDGDEGDMWDDQDRTLVSYDDPSKYTTSGLYDPDETLVPDEVRRKRPVSAVQQRASDAMRSRPKSGVSQKGERPLKFETTRPISAPQKPKNDQRPPACDKITNRSRAKSAPVRRLNRASSTENLLKSSSGEATRTVHQNGLGSARKSHSEEDPMFVKIRRPECVDRFVNDLEVMNKMEEDFKEQTRALQKQLGISPDGMIF